MILRTDAIRGISKYHPDPLAEFERVEAERATAGK